MDYKDVGLMQRGVFEPGNLKVQIDGFTFKSGKTGKSLLVKGSNVEELEWMRVARGYEVKIIGKDGSIFKFDGFKESDYQELRDFFFSHFGCELNEVDLCVKGWNWGQAKLSGSLLHFLVDNKPAFEIPMKEVSQVTEGKHEATLEFHSSEEAPVSLIEMRFHIPNTAAEGEEDPVKVFCEQARAKADVMQATGDAIVTFPEIQCLVPRGRYTIKAFPTVLQLHGKTFDYKIGSDTISRLFLLPHNDQKQMFFVLALDPPIRQGQTRYHFVIFLLPTDEDCSINLALSDEELKERYEGKLTQAMNGTFYEVFSRVMRVLIGRKITVPGGFKTISGQSAIACSHKATSGYLYPLDKGFIFIHKPPVYVKFESVVSVNFARMSGSAGVSRSFDFEVELRDGTVALFSSLMKEDYNSLYSFVTAKNLRIKNKAKVQVASVHYNDDDLSDSDHDAYKHRMMAEGAEMDSEDDSDFVAGASGGSDDDLEFDSDAKIDSNDEEGEESGGEGRPAAKPGPKKRKREAEDRPAQPAKRKKKEDGPAPRKKKGGKEKDPNAPKKPLTAFMLWLQLNRADIKAKHPKISVAEIGKKAGEIWREMDDKSEWSRRAAEAKEEYQELMEEYKASGKAAAFEKKTAAASPAKGAKKSAKPKPKPQPRKSAISSTVAESSSKKFKSAEFVGSDDDSAGGEGSDDEEEERAPPAAKKTGTRSQQPTKGTQLQSLPSGSEDESEAELSSGGSEESSEEESD